MKTVTFDPATHRLVPITATRIMEAAGISGLPINVFSNVEFEHSASVWAYMIAAAPEFPEQPESIEPVLQPDAITDYYTYSKRGKSAPYDVKRIAWELERTAMSDGYWGNALRVALDMQSMTSEDKRVLQRYLNGSHIAGDHFELQKIAMKIFKSEDNPVQQK